MNFVAESNRVFCEDAQGKLLAERTFPDIGYHVVNLSHSFVDESVRGQGVASMLLVEAAVQIRKSGKKVIPTCSYAVKWFQKNPQYADILETKSQE